MPRLLLTTTSFSLSCLPLLLCNLSSLLLRPTNRVSHTWQESGLKGRIILHPLGSSDGRDERWANGVGNGSRRKRNRNRVILFVGLFSPRLVLSRGRGRRRSYRAEVARSTRGKIRSPSFRTRPTPHADSLQTGMARDCADTERHPRPYARSHPYATQLFTPLFPLSFSLSLSLSFFLSLSLSSILYLSLVFGDSTHRQTKKKRRNCLSARGGKVA